MKKTLLVLALTVGTLVSKAQSIGSMGGITITKESKYYNTALGGAWVDFGKWGIQYSASGSLNGSQNEVNNFINGKSKEFNAGIVSQNCGIFINTDDGFTEKDKIYFGGGVQFSKYYNVEIKKLSISVPYTTTQRMPGGGIATISGVNTQYIETPEVVLRNKIIPYGVIGIKYDLGTSFIGRVEVMISKVSSINVGIGIKL